jgi:hypothetical protein
MPTGWPKTSEEAVKICLLTLTAHEKQALKNTSKENLIMCHFGWAVNMRNEFGMWQGNEELIKSCYAGNPDDASMVIVKTVWKELNRLP